MIWTKFFNNIKAKIMATFRKNIKIGTVDPLVGTEEIANKAVTTAKIADGAVTKAKLAEDVYSQYDEDIEELKDAQKYDFNGVETTVGSSSIEIKLTSDDDSQSIFLYSATEDKAGLMSAEDKERLDGNTEKLDAIDIGKTQVIIKSAEKSVTLLSEKKDTIIESAEKNVYLVADTGDVFVIAPGKGVEEPMSLTELIPEAPKDSKTYGRKDGAWTEVTGGGITEKELNDSAGDISLVSLEEFADALYLSETDVPAFFETPYDRVKVCGCTLALQCDYTRNNSKDQSEHHLIYGFKNESIGVMADFFTTDVDGEIMYSFVLDK